MEVIKICLLATQLVLYCDGGKGKHRTSSESDDSYAHTYLQTINSIPMRRLFLPAEDSVILGAPSYAHHLPEAEPIQPGQTLIRPSLGMLKSAIKFPHRELENGAGVYGHYDNLGIKYAGKNERVLYTGFRRLGSENYNNFIPTQKRNYPTDSLILVLLQRNKINDGDTPWPKNQETPIALVVIDRSQDETNSKEPFNNLKSMKQYLRSGPIELNKEDIEKPELTQLLKQYQDSKEKNIVDNDIEESNNMKKQLRSVRTQILEQDEPVQVDIEKPTMKKYLRTIESLVNEEKPKQNDIKIPSIINNLRSFTSFKESRPLRQNNISKHIDSKTINQKEMPKQDKVNRPNKETYLRIIDTLRNGQESRHRNASDQRTLVNLISRQSLEEDEGIIKPDSALFWETQDAYNHIKINADAPNFIDLMPVKSMDEQRNWWYYQQSDFQEFQD